MMMIIVSVLQQFAAISILASPPCVAWTVQSVEFKDGTASEDVDRRKSCCDDSDIVSGMSHGVPSRGTDVDK